MTTAETESVLESQTYTKHLVNERGEVGIFCTKYADFYFFNNL